MHWLATSEQTVLCRRRSRRLLWGVCCGLLAVSLARGQGQENVPDLMQEAIAAQNEGQTPTAIRLYRRVLQLRPGWGPAEYNLGLAISVEKNYVEAVELFNAALEHDPSLSGAYLFRGIAYYNLGDFHNALASLGIFVKKQPADPHVHYYLAGSYSALGEYPNAAVEYLQQMKITPGRGDLYYSLGRCYLAMAHKMLSTLTDAPAGNYYLSLLLGEENAEEAKLSAAEQDMRRAIQQDPKRTEAYVNLGELLLQGGQIATAKAQFQKALELKPGDCSALEGLGDAELAAGNLSDSLANYAHAHQRAPACVPQPPPENLGLTPSEFRSRVESLKIEAARIHRSSAIDLELSRLEYGAIKDGINAGAHPESRECDDASRAGGPQPLIQKSLFLASCDELYGDVAGTTAALAAADRSNATDAASLFPALRILMSLSQSVLDSLAVKAPNSYLIGVMRAEWLELRGDDAGADSAYQRAVQASGNDPDVLIEYATFECKRNKLDEAAPMLIEALRQAPYNATANALLGYVYFTKNQFDQAIPYLDKAIKANSSDEQSRIYLGESLRNIHKTREAVTILENAASDPDGRVHYVLASCYRELGQKEKMQRAMAFFGERQKELHTRQKSVQ